MIACVCCMLSQSMSPWAHVSPVETSNADRPHRSALTLPLAARSDDLWTARSIHSHCGRSCVEGVCGSHSESDTFDSHCGTFFCRCIHQHRVCGRHQSVTSTAISAEQHSVKKQNSSGAQPGHLPKVLGRSQGAKTVVHNASSQVNHSA